MRTVFAISLFAVLASPVGGEPARVPATATFQLPTEPEMNAMVDLILGLSGITLDIRVVVDPTTKTCAYATTRSGRHLVGVDPACVGPLRTSGRYNWRALGVLTHEIGHIVCGHTLNSTSSPAEELEADAWSGAALRRLGASLEEAQTVYRTFSVSGGKVHPPRAVRLDSVARGWAGQSAQTIAQVHRDDSVGERWAQFLKRPLPWIARR